MGIVYGMCQSKNQLFLILAAVIECVLPPFLQYKTVCVVNTLWGRLDQMLGNICTLFQFNKPELYLISEDSVSIALQKVKVGMHLCEKQQLL